MWSRLNNALNRLPIQVTLVLPFWAYGLFLWVIARAARGSLAELLAEDQKLMLVFKREGVTNLTIVVIWLNTQR
jgi:type IV secretory pathway TrbD component